MDATEMMAAAMVAREEGRALDAADLYAVAGDLLEEQGSIHAYTARYWAQQCSTFPLRRGVVRAR